MLKNAMKRGEQDVFCTTRGLSGEMGFWNVEFYEYQYRKEDLIEENIQELEMMMESLEVEDSFEHMDDGYILEWLYEKCLYQARTIIKRTLKNLKEKQVIDYLEVYQVQCSGFGPDVIYYIEPSNKKEWDIIQRCNRAADRKYVSLLNDKFLEQGKAPIALELEHGQLLYRLYVNGMIDEYYETLGRLYSVMYKKENLLDERMKFRRIIPAYKIWYTSTAEYKDVDICEHMFNLNEMFMKSVYNSFKKKRKMIESIAYSDDPNHSVILYTYKDGDKMNIDVSGRDFDRTAFYRNIDLYCIRYWMCKILKIINEDEKFFVVEIE